MNPLADSRPQTLLLLSYAAVLLAAIAVFANSLWNGFAYDDVHIIQTNARVAQLADQAKIWLTPYWPGYGEQYGLYRPLAIFAFAVQWKIGGGEPWVFHLVNVLVHAGVSLLVLRLLLFFAPLAAATAGALVFAVHPLHTEAVANGVGQSELIAAAATLAAVVLHARRPAGHAVSWPLRAAHVVLFLVAVLAKENAIMMPVLLVVVDLAQGRIAWSRKGVLEYARALGMLVFLIGAATAAYLVVRVEVLGSITGQDAAPSLPFLREEHRILTAFRAWPEFARLLFFPLDLSADYGPAVILPMTHVTPMVALGMLLFAATVACALLLARAPIVGLPAAWFLVTVFTVSNLVFPIGVVVAERTLYTPSVAVAFIVAAIMGAAARAEAAQTRRLAVAGLALVVVAMSVRTWVRNPTWKDNQAVFTTLQRDRPEAYRSHWATAVELSQLGRLDEAEPYWRIAYMLWPRNPAMNTEYANFLNRRHRWHEALPLLEDAVQAIPWSVPTRYYLAETYLTLGNAEAGLENLAEAHRLGRLEPSVYFTQLARAYELLGDSALALAAWRTAVRTDRTNNWLLQAHLARAAARAGYDAEAAAVATRAIDSAPATDLATQATTALHGAVAAGCFTRPEAGAGCEDPLRRFIPFR